MRLLKRLLARFRNLAWRQSDDQRFLEEMEEHLSRQTEEHLRAGMTAAEARRQALLKFGAVEAIREQYHAEKSLPFIESVVQDVRYSLRILRKSWGFTSIATISLALAIGANTTIFSVMKRVLLDRLDVPHAEQLRLLHWHGDKHTAVSNMWGMSDSGSEGIGAASFSYPAFEQLRSDNHVLEDLFAFKDVGRMNATIDGNAQILQGELVSGNFFHQLQVQPQLGRPILTHDDRIGAPTVALISAELWQRAFRSSPAVVGRTIKLNMVPVTIVGVAPQWFTGAKSVQSSPDIFLPLSSQPLVEPRGKNGSLLGASSPQVWWLNIMGRTRAGLRTTLPRLLWTHRCQRSCAQPCARMQTPPSLDWTCWMAVADCSSRSRFREAPRSADGSRRPWFFSWPAPTLQACCLRARWQGNGKSPCGSPSAPDVLACCAACLQRASCSPLSEERSAWLWPLPAAAALPALLANPWETSQFRMPLDWTVLAFTASVTLLSGLLFGTVPAWIATRSDGGACLKATGPGSTRRRKGFSGKMIVTFQVMLSTLLVAGALLFVETLFQLAHVNPGFRTDHLVLFAIQQPESRYPSPKDLQLHHQIEERLRALHGVQSVTLSEVAYISDSMESANFLPEGERPNPEKDQSAWNNAVGSGFFHTMGIPILAGRDFNESDTANAPKVGILSESLARKAFPGQNPIGKRFLAHFLSSESKPGDLIEVVGICGDTRYWSLKQDPIGMFYQPYQQTPNLDFGATYEVRTSLSPASIAPSLREAVQSIDPDLPLQEIRTQQERIDASMQQERIIAALTASFGVLALVLASVGVYGVMAYSVAQRTSEIGIRIALGALPREVLAMVLREATWIALVGITCGIVATALATRFVTSLLYGLHPNDPAILATSALLLAVVGLAASWAPARHAAAVEPMEALRHE